MTPKESDWKLYSKLVPFWRDRYLQVKNRELSASLSHEGIPPAEQFWEAKGRMDSVAGVLNEGLGHQSRSNMSLSLLLMHRHGLITDEDVSQFSEVLRQDIIQCVKKEASV